MATEAQIKQAKEYHSITFYTPPSAVLTSMTVDYTTAGIGSNPKNTWYDWHLVPSARPVFNPPAIRTNYVEVPGRNGYLDFTNSLSENIFGAREGSITFLVMNDYGIWHERYLEMMNYVHGKLLNAVLNDDMTKFYHGRWQVEEWTNNNDGTCSSITLGYHLQPDFVSGSFS